MLCRAAIAASGEPAALPLLAYAIAVEYCVASRTKFGYLGGGSTILDNLKWSSHLKRIRSYFEFISNAWIDSNISWASMGKAEFWNSWSSMYRVTILSLSAMRWIMRSSISLRMPSWNLSRGLAPASMSISRGCRRRTDCPSPSLGARRELGASKGLHKHFNRSITPGNAFF